MKFMVKTWFYMTLHDYIEIHQTKVLKPVLYLYNIMISSVIILVI